MRPGLLVPAMVFACGAFAAPVGAQTAPNNARMPCHNASEIAKQLSNPIRRGAGRLRAAVQRQSAPGLLLPGEGHLDRGQHHPGRHELHRRCGQALGKSPCREQRTPLT